MLIAMPVTNRPGFLARSLDSWGRVRPPEDGLEFIFAVEPDSDIVPEIISKYAGTFNWKVQISQNENRLGPDLNPGHVLELGFRDSETVIYTEDDVIVSSDIAEFFTWGLRQFRYGSEVLAVCAFEEHGNHDPSIAHPDFSFSPHCFGMWGDRWARVRSWDFPRAEGFGWPEYIQQRHLMPTGRHVIKPWQSRSQHIGYRSAASDRPFVQSSSFTDDVPPQDYKLSG